MYRLSKDEVRGTLFIVALFAMVIFVIGWEANLPEQTPPCECICKEGCKLFHFKDATCAIGPEDNTCCVVKRKI